MASLHGQPLLTTPHPCQDVAALTHQPAPYILTRQDVLGLGPALHPDLSDWYGFSIRETRITTAQHSKTSKNVDLDEEYQTV
jgi:hypothetical protein